MCACVRACVRETEQDVDEQKRVDRKRDEQLARLQSKIRWIFGGGVQVVWTREGREVTRAQTPTESIEDSTRHGTEVPDRASSSATLCSSSNESFRARATFT